MQVERRGNMFTMPRRRRFKPRIDCVAILGKLSSRLVTRAATHIYNPSHPPFEKGGFFCVYTQMPNPGFDLKSRLNAATYVGLLVKIVHKIGAVSVYWSKIVHKCGYLPAFFTCTLA